MLGCGDRLADQPWPGLPRPGRWRRGLGGQRLGEIGVPFAKLEDETVADEIRRLEVRAPA
jgi:hypothetical protein